MRQQRDVIRCAPRCRNGSRLLGSRRRTSGRLRWVPTVHRDRHGPTRLLLLCQFRLERRSENNSLSVEVLDLTV
jgi:hypothetical protein